MLIVTHAAVIESAIQALVPGTLVPEVGDGAITELREIGEGMEDEGGGGGVGRIWGMCARWDTWRRIMGNLNIS